MTPFRYPLSEAGPTSPWSGFSDEARTALLGIALGPSLANRLLGNQDNEPDAETERASLALQAFAEQLYPDDDTARQDFIDGWVIQTDPDSHQAAIYKLDPKSGETIDDYDLDISERGLTGQLAIPEQLRISELYCGGNQLTSLPELPASLTGLDCSDNQLTSLPELPASLTRLYCSDNQLTSLPDLPASLTRLHCYSNQLTSLPELPASLTGLDCSDNQLTSLPDLPASLTGLDCYSNQLTSLPELPASLIGLYCYSNQLTSLPELPASLIGLDCYSNPLDKQTRSQLKKRGFSA